MDERNGLALLGGLIAVLVLLVIAQFAVAIKFDNTSDGASESELGFLTDVVSTGSFSAGFLAVLAVITLYIKKD